MHPSLTRRALAGAIASLPFAAAFAQGAPAVPAGWPSKPVTLVTPFAAGSGPDVVARAFAERLSKGLGARVIVENRPGASGFIALDAVTRAGADGHTFLQLDSEHLAAVPSLYPQRRFKPFDTLAPIATFFRTPFLVVVPSDSPWKTLGDLVGAARARPGALTYGSWGVGSPGHLGGEHLEVLTGATMQHVPFKAASELFTAVGNNDVQWSFGSIASSQATFRYGKVRYLAVAAPKRIAAMPDVPTVAEAGGPAALDVNSFVVLMAPRGVAPGIVARMNAEMAKASADPELRAKLDTFAFEPITWSPEEIVRNADVKAKVYGDLIRRADIRLE
jgi:tripartite-type tricarboxylate transporter receptor subunit TctC